jgi:hypothetical protein
LGRCVDDADHDALAYFSLHASDLRDPRRQPEGHRPYEHHRADRRRQDSADRVPGVHAQMKATQVLFDKDHGLDILVRAEGSATYR